jgi:transposase-like protein
METKRPETLIEAVKYFSDPERAFNAAIELRWPNGITCPVCAGKVIAFIPSEKRWNCKNKECRKRFSVKSGSIFENSPLTLETWLIGIWLVGNAKNGISSHEIARSLGITQKSAWFLRARVHELMGIVDIDKMDGIIEADETYIGGLEKNKHAKKRLHAGTGSIGKAAVFALLERGKTSRVRTKHVPDATANTLQWEIRGNVKKEAAIFTDESPSYNGLTQEYYRGTVNHSAGEYVNGEVHTNGLENWFSLFQRCYGGTWTHLSEAHLQRYLNEQAFRFNNRAENDGTRFAMLASGINGKRLTYEELKAE